jgi:hypothetical protein
MVAVFRRKHVLKTPQEYFDSRDNRDRDEVSLSWAAR